MENRPWRKILRILSIALFAILSIVFFFFRAFFRAQKRMLVHLWRWLLRTLGLKQAKRASLPQAPPRLPAATPDTSEHGQPAFPAPVERVPKTPHARVPDSRFRLFIPSTAESQPGIFGRNRRPLLVMMHGCLQNASSMEEGARMNEVAEREGFYVLYPDQQRGRNMMNCWNWFDPMNQRPFSGELGEVLKMIEQVEDEHPIDKKKIFIAGISAGAGTAASLLACHPERFAGGILHSGPAYAAADGAFHGAHALKHGPMSSDRNPPQADPQDFTGKLIVIQGDRDRVVHWSHVERLIEQFATAKELAKPHVMSWTEPGEDKYPAEVIAYGSSSSPRICRIEVKGLGHAWSGGKNMSFNDPRGPSVNELFARYFLHSELPFSTELGQEKSSAR